MAPRWPRDDLGSVPGRFGAGGCGGGRTPCKGWCHAIPGAAAAASRPESSNSLVKRAETWRTGRSAPNCGCAGSTRCAWRWARSGGSSEILALARLQRTPKRIRRQLKLFEKAEPRERVQVDVKFVKIAGHWACQYTALDDCTRFRVLRLYRRLHQSSSLAFLGELCRAFPFRIRKLQCDHGHEFPFAFALAVEALGIRHRYIKPRRPQQNGKVERSHRIDHEEFWGRQRFDDFAAATVGLRAWETRYNHERFCLALQGRTPAEKLASLLPAPAA